MKFPIALLALALCTAAAAQGMYKCRNGAGRITYSGNECHLIGLTSAGEVTGRASVTPAIKPPATQPAPSAGPANPPASSSQSAAKEPAAPEKRCFTVKTAKGSSTRCNDSPEEEAGSK